MVITYSWRPIEKVKYRMEPAFWDPKYDTLEAAVLGAGWEVNTLGDLIASITYGQVGRRLYDPKGAVRYIQVRHITRTGIDFLASPARIAEGSHNDPERSRVEVGDILYVNSGIGSLGRCICVTEDYGKVNVSQDIDVIRVKDIHPEYVVAYLMSHLGQMYSERWSHGVSRMIKISFGEVKSIPIPVLPRQVQEHVHGRYRQMIKVQDAALEAKLLGDETEYKGKLGYAEQLLDELTEYVANLIETGPRALQAEE